MTAIVLDGQLKSALCAVRSLGAQGVSVVCAAERSTAMACHSRFVRRHFIYSPAKTDPVGFVEDIIAQSKKLYDESGEKPVIFAFSDATSLLLAREYDRITPYAVMPMPSLESVEIAADKERTYALASELSIPTINIYNKEAWDTILYPAVVKNRHSLVWKEEKPVSGSAAFVFSRNELESTYNTVYKATGEAPLVMKFVEGDEYGIEVVCDRGEVLASFAHKRIRSLSPRGGAAVVKETASETDEVRMMHEYAYALMRRLAWTGPAMVEFKIDTETGQVLLMEINGRFWGSLPLAVRAGVDFPLITYALARGAVSKLQTSLPRRVRTRHFLGDCKWLIAVLFARDPLRKILYPSRLRALYDFKKEFFISKDDIFSWSDPVPALFEYLDILNKWKSKA